MYIYLFTLIYLFTNIRLVLFLRRTLTNTHIYFHILLITTYGPSQQYSGRVKIRAKNTAEKERPSWGREQNRETVFPGNSINRPLRREFRKIATKDSAENACVPPKGWGVSTVERKWWRYSKCHRSGSVEELPEAFAPASVCKS